MVEKKHKDANLGKEVAKRIAETFGIDYRIFFVANRSNKFSFPGQIIKVIITLITLVMRPNSTQFKTIN
jgi:hypothetical protein